MLYAFLIVLVILLIYIIFRYGPLIEKFANKVLNNTEPTLYPLFEKWRIIQVQQHLNDLQTKYNYYSQELTTNDNFRQDTPYTPTKEELGIIIGFFETKAAYEYEKEFYNFMIESNASIINSKSKITEIEKQWTDLSIQGSISRAVKIEKDITTFVDMLKNPEKKNRVEDASV